RLQQIVWNLLSNAVKFTPRGGRISVVLRRDGPWARISITDTGKGIDPRFLPHVFDPFRQEDASYSRSRGGLGLGLAITRQLVELQGGRIDVTSDGEGRGSTFTVRVPLSAPGRANAAEPRRPVPQLRGLHVLVVDDEGDARHIVKAVLEEQGCRVSEAASAG